MVELRSDLGEALTDKRVERRLAAVLAADVAGYSRLMGADEEGTLDKLKALRKALFDPKIVEHRGRIVKTTGDGMLVEFASAVDAARCAVEIQRDMATQNSTVPPELRIEFRMGIHVGDLLPNFHPAAIRVSADFAPSGAGGAICDRRSWSGLRSR